LCVTAKTARIRASLIKNRANRSGAEFSASETTPFTARSCSPK
jgi:hypothetical protein